MSNLIFDSWRKNPKFLNQIKKLSKKSSFLYSGLLIYLYCDISLNLLNFFRIYVTENLGCLSCSAYRNSWALDARVGHWTLDTGLWTLDSGHWTLDIGLWTLDSGHWTLDTGPWTLDAGPWTLDAGLWILDPGLWTLNARLWMLKL